MLEELKKIRAILEPKPPPPPPKNLVEEFKLFIAKYKILGLAVAFVMAIYVGNLIQALVNSFILPLVNFVLPPGLGWETWTIGPFTIGLFLSALITFIIVAFVIFLVVKLTSRFGIE